MIRKTCHLVANYIDPPCVVLLYHRVTKLKSDPRLLAVSSTHFDQHLSYLKKHHHVLAPEELSYLINTHSRIPQGSVVLTFDDGYADNLIEAVPILEAHDLPAIFFIATQNIDTQQEFWWDELERIFLTGQSLPRHLALATPGVRQSLATGCDEDRRLAYDHVRQVFRHATADNQARMRRDLQRWAGVSPIGRESHRSLSSAEVAALARTWQMEIGAHTETHSQLSLYPRRVQHSDIEQSKQRLELLIGRPVRFFSYPFGEFADYNLDSIKACRELGFELAMVNHSLHAHRWSSPMQVPRAIVRDWDIKEFQLQLQGYLHAN